ncbi:MFS transporter [Actinopolymorpha alba]|uniref:MFS transporter n=1 Tax=Actinopolymorpha alba TaxID=533267 RepID=UPI00058C2DB2|nr:MFS transporter [Actinopolymorpha alba]
MRAERATPHTVRSWAPFRRRAFFWLWLGVVISSVGTWAQTVGAQWLFVNDPRAATIVPLVQTASTLPMMLLALPAGALADAFDRRGLLFVVQVYFIGVAVLLAVLTALGMMPPALLLTFTFLVGAGQAMSSPTWQALITELVPRNELAAATRLDMVSVNVARAAGPALAGFVIAYWGVPPVFALNAVATTVLAVVLLAWRRPRVTRGERERFIPALRAGSRYVRHEPVVRTILLRFATFVFPAGAVWALLPLIASRQLGLAADGYGVLFAALGVGAVVGALGLGRVKQRLSSNTVLAVAGAAFALAFAAVAVTSSMSVAMPLLVVCGIGWTATVATVISELQLFLPGWVRARVIAVYLMVFLGTQAVAAPIWGLVTQLTSLRVALLAAAALVGFSAAAGRVLRVPDSHQLDRSPLAYWDTPRLAVDPDPTVGPVVVSIQYEVDDDHQPAFLAAMRAMRRSRLRSGATRWRLYRVGEDVRLFIEQFEVSTWQEHQRQHDGRLTAEDKAIEDAAFSHIAGTPRTHHLLPSTPE